MSLNVCSVISGSIYCILANWMQQCKKTAAMQALINEHDHEVCVPETVASEVLNSIGDIERPTEINGAVSVALL